MSTPAVTGEPAPALNEGQRLLYTFTAPSQTMQDLRRNASWWVPWLILSVISLGFCFAVDKRIGWEQVVENQIQKNPKAAEKLEKLPPAQLDKIMTMQVNITKGIAYGVPVVLLILACIVSGVLAGTFNFGFGAKLRFAELMAVTFYSWLISIVQSALSLILMFVVQPDQFDIQNPVATNLGYFVPATSTFLKSVLGAFDVITIWQIAVIAIGISVLSKVKKGPAFATIFSLYFIVKLIGAGLGSLNS
ncbi:MAG: YIP1 family protein [Acidobacteriota bacterium]|nr:YIP1 family protein [Acidobacteriota bacterium]